MQIYGLQKASSCVLSLDTKSRISNDAMREQVLEGASQAGLTAAGDGSGLQALSEVLEGILALDAKAATPGQASQLKP